MTISSENAIAKLQNIDAPTNKSSQRVFVISDLHLGGESPSMMSKPEQLAEFIRGLSERLSNNETGELVIAGDFIDFLAVEDFKSWTPDPDEAVAKLRETTEKPSPFAPIFDALSELLASVSIQRLVILIGNHDTELTIPQVQAALVARLQTSPHQVHFVDDGSAYRVGNLLIEHGNRYDGANRNDWDGLRAHRSAHSRGERAPVDVDVSAGSQLVEALVSPLKPRYPFIDLLQPGGPALALLLLAFEPRLLGQWNAVTRIIHAKRRQDVDRSGGQPDASRNVSAAIETFGDEELQEAFGDAYRKLSTPPTARTVGALDVMTVTLDSLRHGGLKQKIENGEPISPQRLHKIRAALRNMLPAVETYQLSFDDPDCVCRKAAQRLLDQTDAQTVIMGHTHFARQIGPSDRASYINTGTWADVVRIPAEVVAEGEDALTHLSDFLKQLTQDEVREQHFYYADVAVDATGDVTHARLKSVSNDD